jgi:hypothetical protein
VIAKVGVDFAVNLAGQHLDTTEQESFKPIVGVAIPSPRFIEGSMSPSGSQ